MLITGRAKKKINITSPDECLPAELCDALGCELNSLNTCSHCADAARALAPLFTLFESPPLCLIIARAWNILFNWVRGTFFRVYGCIEEIIKNA